MALKGYEKDCSDRLLDIKIASLKKDLENKDCPNRDEVQKDLNELQGLKKWRLEVKDKPQERGMGQAQPKKEEPKEEKAE